MMKTSQPTRFKIRLKKGDLVMITKGKLKGQKAKITAIHPRLNKVSLENLNLVKKHFKPTKIHPQGGIIEISQPIWVSNLALIEPSLKKPTKIAYKIDSKGQKQRIYKKSQKVIPTVGLVKKSVKNEPKK